MATRTAEILNRPAHLHKHDLAVPAFSELSKEELQAELAKAEDDIKKGNVYTHEEIKTMLLEDFGIYV